MGKVPSLRRKGKPLQPVRPWNDQTGHLPDWLVGTRTQLGADPRSPAVGRRVESRIRGNSESVG